MGCGPSKADQAVEEPKGSTSPKDVQLEDSKQVNAAGRRVSKTVRRIAVRYASEHAPNLPTWEGIGAGWSPRRGCAGPRATYRG